MSTFTLELGFEELPARFLADLERNLKDKFNKSLEDNDLAFSEIETHASPRRACVIIRGLGQVQAWREEELVGPAVRIAYADDGSLSKAGQGFARGAGVSPEQIYTVETEKGQYIAVKKVSGGRRTQDVLADICPDLITALPFPKRMHWGSGDFLFARPLRSILALLDAEIVQFKLGTLQSDRTILGHRVHGKGSITINNADEYLDVVKKTGGITLIASERREIIINLANEQAEKLGGKIIWDEALLDEVQGLVEHPVPIIGDIDAKYLELPREVLLTSMQQHQKSFGLENESGELLPHFVTVLNITPPDLDLVKKGWERVLRARLEDAMFFWKADLELDFEHWLEKLNTVSFLAPLGSMGDKARRISELCAELATTTKACAPENAKQAGLIAKADLVSGMVGEFDTLQGIMGSIYAYEKGISPSISVAIAEQYLPAGPDSQLPNSTIGAILSIADKVDTLVGCFGLGMIPTGTADPYALRRCALGIARIMADKQYRFNIQDIFRFSLKLYGERKWKFSEEEIINKLSEFYLTRVKNLFLSQNYETLLVEAVCSTGSFDVYETSLRLNALREMSMSNNFTASVQCFKRIANIIAKQKSNLDLTVMWEDKLLQEDAEKALAHSIKVFVADYDKMSSEDNYAELFNLLDGIRKAIDHFFDKVMVMAEDTVIRENRLRMLYSLYERLIKLADFSVLQI